MHTNDDSISRDKRDTPAAASKHAPAQAIPDEPAATKPPLLWMVLPLILIGLAIYFAR